MKFLCVCLAVLVGLLSPVITQATAAAAYYMNDNIHRTVELTGALVREQRAIAIVTEGESTKDASSIGEYYLAVETFPGKTPNVSVASVQATDKTSGLPLKVVPVSNTKDFLVRGWLKQLEGKGRYVRVGPEGYAVVCDVFSMCVSVVPSGSVVSVCVSGTRTIAAYYLLCPRS